MSLLPTINARGVLASRPAAAAANEGYNYFGTDTGILYRSNGSSWDTNSAGFTNPMTTSGDIIYGGSSGLPTRLAKGSDGQVLTLASGVPSWAAAGSGGYFKHATASRTAGSYTLSSTTEASVDTGLDLTLAAATGDVVVVNLNGLWGNEDRIANLDVATIVSSSPVSYFGAGLASSAQGLLGWSKQNGGATYEPISGSASLVLGSGDVSGGNVLLRLRYKVNAASITLFGTSDLRFKWSAFVLRPT